MDPSQGGLSAEYSSRQALFERTISEAHERLNPYVELVESRTPDHNFGRRVVAHMLELHSEALELGQDEGLSVGEIQMLAMGLALHDVGRVLCEAERPGDRSYQHGHGGIGAKFLDSEGLLDNLAPEDKQVLLDIVTQHSTKDVTLTPGTTAYKICYILRDLDKEALLSNNKEFLSPAGAVRQMSMWMLSDPANEALEKLEPEQRAELYDYIQPILAGQQVPEDVASQDPLTQEIVAHLTREIPTDYQEKVAAGKLLTKEEMISGYPAYMIAHVAMCSDIQSQSVKNKIHKEDTLAARVEFLELTANYASDIVSSVTDTLK